MDTSFETVGPISLYVELGGGGVDVHADEVTETTIHLDGPDADETVVEQRGDRIVVIAPRRRAGFFMPGSDVRVTARIPVDSELVTKTGSADVTATGRYGTVRVRTGSGEVRIAELTDNATVETGSGDVRIDSSLGHLRVRAGSGDVAVDRTAGPTVVATGSGDIALGHTEEETVLKSGSGDVLVQDAHTNLSASTASGDVRVDLFRVGSLKAKAVSGDVAVGVPAGIPVWTDVTAVSGSVSSDLKGAGRPRDGQDFIELRATTVSGDIRLEQR
jgi:DUF4097 and DUF4098 domain-containing protein YvlB